MPETRLNFLKQALAECSASQDKATAAWHINEPHDVENIENIPSDIDRLYYDGVDVNRLLSLTLAQHLMNFKLWHIEDQARRKDVGDAAIAACKRNIDIYNQRRNNFMEEVDASIVSLYLLASGPEAENTADQMAEKSRYNTETLGAALDRLSILSLKTFHMREETGRSDVPQAHIDSCGQKLDLLLEQRNTLFTAILELVDDYASGAKRPRVYYQLKMYNNPKLNPAVYKNR